MYLSRFDQDVGDPAMPEATNVTAHGDDVFIPVGLLRRIHSHLALLVLDMPHIAASGKTLINDLDDLTAILRRSGNTEYPMHWLRHCNEEDHE
jgi:hypothetical protein